MPEINLKKYKCKKCGGEFLSRAKEPRCPTQNFTDLASEDWGIKCGSRRIELVAMPKPKVVDVVEYIPGPPPNPNAASLIGFHKWLDIMKLEVHTTPQLKVDHYMKYLDSLRAKTIGGSYGTTCETT